MSMETMPARYDRSDKLAECPDTDAPARRDTVVIVGAGQNTAHMGGSIERLGAEHPVHVFEVSQPLIPVTPDRLHMTNTPEGHASARQLLGSGAVHASYLSVIPRLHEPILKEHLDYAAEGKLDFIVVPKPIAQDVAELRRMNAILQAAITRRREIDPDYDPKKDPLIYIHEHYIEKGAWHVVRESLGKVTEQLGQLRSVSIDIQETRTAEEEGRTLAFAGGALEDLGPHVISLGLDIQTSINTTDRYEIPDRSQTSVERFRYEDSELPEGVETGFIVHGNTTLIDKETGEAHDLPFTWSGGKGLRDHKEIVLEFEHPETGDRSTLRVDLRANTIEAPESIRGLFPTTEFEDNGYGRSVEVGLNGGNPRTSFQSWEQARTVTKWQANLKRQGQTAAPLLYPKGRSLQELALAA